MLESIQRLRRNAAAYNDPQCATHRSNTISSSHSLVQGKDQTNAPKDYDETLKPPSAVLHEF